MTLIAQTRDPDSRLRDHAWTDIVAKNHQPLYRMCMSMVRNSEEAEDIVSETFLRAFENRHKIADATKVQAFLFTISYRLCISWLRKRKRQARYLEEGRHSQEQYQEPEPGLRYNLLQLTGKLPEVFKEAILLRYFADWTNKEISKELGIPVKTVRTRIHRGLIRLKNIGIKQGGNHARV